MALADIVLHPHPHHLLPMARLVVVRNMSHETALGEMILRDAIFVIPAEAGISAGEETTYPQETTEIPASAGMTSEVRR